MTANSGTKVIRWVRQVQAPGGASPAPLPALAPAERLLLALADGPRTVAQLAQQFALAQPTVLEQVRRAVLRGLIVEVQVPQAERRFAGERYYAPAVPVIRPPDREILETACYAVAAALAAALREQQAAIVGAVVLTNLYRDGWHIAQLWPYLQETIYRLALERAPGLSAPAALGPDGPVWLEIFPGEPGDREEVSA